MFLDVRSSDAQSLELVVPVNGIDFQILILILILIPILMLCRIMISF